MRSRPRVIPTYAAAAPVVLADGDVRAVDGVALGAVDGGGVGELDEPGRVLRREHRGRARGRRRMQAAVVADAGDGPGLAVRDAEVGVVAAGGDPVPEPDPFAAAVVTIASAASPVAAVGATLVADRGVEAATCSRVSATTRSPAAPASARAAVRSTVAGVDDDLPAASSASKTAAGSSPVRIRRVRVGVVGVGEPVHRLQGDDRGRGAPSATARSRTPPRPTAGSWCRSPTSATRAPVSSAMVSRARAVSWSSIPASSTSSRSPGRSRAAGIGGRRRVGRVQWPSSSQRQPCWWISQAAECPSAPVSRGGDLGRLQRRGHHHQPVALLRRAAAWVDGQGGGLARHRPRPRPPPAGRRRPGRRPPRPGSGRSATSPRPAQRGPAGRAARRGGRAGR